MPPLERAGPYRSIRRRGASHGSCASNESITSANGCRARAHSIQPIPSRKTFAALYCSSGRLRGLSAR